MKRRVHRHEVVQPLDQSYRFIPLTQGQNALVDAADFDWLTQFNWCAVWSKGTRSFYPMTWKDGRAIRMHQVILGCKNKQEGDHINHDTLDNRRQNIRKCTHGENCRNRKMCRANTSGYKGAFWMKDRNKWQSQIMKNGKKKYLGQFDSAQEAARAYDHAALLLHGEFAGRNSPT